MKHLFKLLFVAFFFPLYLFSQPVNINEAKKVAKNFYLSKLHYNNYKISSKNLSKGNEIKNVITKVLNGHNSYYIINYEGGGWAIVAGHRSKGPVLGYSYVGTLEEGGIPDVFYNWMRQYEIGIDIAYKNNLKIKSKELKWKELEDSDGQIPDVMSEIIPPNDRTLRSASGTWPDVLLDTEWGQGNNLPNHQCGYNRLMNSCNDCGMYCNLNEYCDLGQPKCLAGCATVAIAQILNHWGYAQGDYADFDWWGMGVNYTTPVSYLMLQTVLAFDVNQCSNGCESGWNKYSDEDFVKNKFAKWGYETDDMEYKKKGILVSYNTWLNMLCDEINGGRPVLYGIPGHQLVCDGYNSANGNFHWNMGWDGVGDLWADFEDMDDEVNKHDAWIGIKPKISSNIDLDNEHINTSASDSRQVRKTYQARYMINTGNNYGDYFIVENNAYCRFVAGSSIKLNIGFTARSGINGSGFQAIIYGGNYLKSAPVMEKEEIGKMEESFLNDWKGFIVAPNPAFDYVEISPLNSNIKADRINIYDYSGKMTLDLIPNQNGTVTVDISRLEKGMYVLKVYCSNRLQVEKIIKQ